MESHPQYGAMSIGSTYQAQLHTQGVTPCKSPCGHSPPLGARGPRRRAEVSPAKVVLQYLRATAQGKPGQNMTPGWICQILWSCRILFIQLQGTS